MYFFDYFIKNQQITIALTFLIHIISDIGGVHSLWTAPNPNSLIMYLIFLLFSSFLFDSCFVHWNCGPSAAPWMLPLSNEDWLVCPLGRQKTIWCLSLYESHSDNCVPLLVLFSSQNAQRKDNKETWKVRDLINFDYLLT